MQRKQQGGELITATITMTRDQWALLSMLVHNSAPMVCGSCWASTEQILDTINTELEQADPNPRAPLGCDPGEDGEI